MKRDQDRQEAAAQAMLKARLREAEAALRAKLERESAAERQRQEARFLRLTETARQASAALETAQARADELGERLRREEMTRQAAVDELVAKRLAGAQATARAAAKEESAAQRKEQDARIAELAEQSRLKDEALTSAQARANELESNLRLEEQQHAAAAEKLAREREAQARERTRHEFEAEHQAEHAAWEASKDQLSQLVKRLEQEKYQLQRDLDSARPAETGTVDESDLLDRLSVAFKDDQVRLNPVRRGADLLHTVKYDAGGGTREAGLIIYECKKTKTWSEKFITQTRTERDAQGAQFGVLVSHKFPKEDMRPLFVRDGVAVVDPDHVIAVATLLRQIVIETDRVRSSGKERQLKDHLLHEYIAGQEFRRDVEFMQRGLNELDKSLKTEKRAHEKTWADRAKLYLEIAERVGQVDARTQSILHGVSTGSSDRHGPRRRRA